jgi:hypothetical protein
MDDPALGLKFVNSKSSSTMRNSSEMSIDPPSVLAFVKYYRNFNVPFKILEKYQM